MTDAPLSEGRRRLGARTALLPGTGLEALGRLARARVLVVGAGGLGAPVVTLLAGSGLARLTIVDPDVVDPTNLARQTLFTAADVGRSKAELAVARARAVDPELEAVAVVGTFDLDLVAGHDLVVDAADAVLVTRAVSDACAPAGVPFVWGTALGYDGQVSAFWDARGIDFHDLHPDPLPDEGSCAVDGVLPALCHAVGAVMAAQVGALLAGIGEPLLGTVLTVDARTWEWTRSTVRRGPASRRPDPAPAVPEPATTGARGDAPEAIRASRLAELLAGPHPPVLVDVRTDAERALGVIPGAVVPADVPEDATDVVVYCARGPRSIAWAEARNGAEVRVLDGGIEAWIDAIGKLVEETPNPVS